MLNKSDFITLMMPIGEVFDKQITEAVLDIYYDILKDYSVEALKNAFNRVLRNHQYNTMPKPADILEYLEGTRDDKALMAWLQAKEAVQKGGYYASVIFKDPIIAHALNELGGWQEFCCAQISELPFIEKRFKDIYRLLEKREVKDNIKLIGFVELHNGETGYTDKISEPIKIGFETKEVKQIEAY